MLARVRSSRHWGSVLALLGIAGLATPLWGQTTSYDGRIGAVETSVSSYGANQAPRFDCLRLGSGDRLQVAFDLLGREEPILEYRLVHCNADWSPSSLQPIEYVGGFATYELDAPQPSHATLMPYVHYHLTLPNDNMQIKRSGNYLLEISHLGGGDPLLRVPLAVSEEAIQAKGQVSGETFHEVKGRLQQVDISLSGAMLSHVARPESELRVVVLQNGRWDNAVWLHQPSINTAGTIHYDQVRGAVFPAGNEYHKLEHLTERGTGMGIQNTQLREGLYALTLYPRSTRSTEGYRYELDRNGAQVIRAQHTTVPEIEADYHLVDFTFVSDRELDGDIVLDGEAFAHLSLEERALHYDASSRCYRISLPLKQGYQEYLFLHRPRGQRQMLTAPTEGDYYQTTNHYTILVYHRGPSDRADRLLTTLEL